MRGGVLCHPLFLVARRPTRPNVGHIGDAPVTVRGFHGLSIVVRQREVKSAAGLSRLGLRAGCIEGARRIPVSRESGLSRRFQVPFGWRAGRLSHRSFRCPFGSSGRLIWHGTWFSGHRLGTRAIYRRRRLRRKCVRSRFADFRRSVYKSSGGHIARMPFYQSRFWRFDPALLRALHSRVARAASAQDIADGRW
jgi:hypothetical protein